jgi:NAD(P)-dependent dehydrogenase (short-subunit alcohol dehydrogenase family)
MMNLKGKVALVTGGNSGIGRAIALAFAREGAKVVIAARRAELGNEVVDEITAAGGEGLFIQADVSRSNEVETLMTKIVAAYGRLDCAANNAATDAGVFALTADFDEAEFDAAVNANLKSVWLCMKHEIQQMVRQRPAGAAIVNTSSVNGLGGALQGSLYSAAKSGVLALTKSAAQEYAEHGIRINALVAGAFRTPMLEHVLDRFSGGDLMAKQALEAKYNSLIPLKRIGRAQEAAEAVVWLCSEAASYVTGHSMIVDGGMTAPFR